MKNTHLLKRVGPALYAVSAVCGVSGIALSFQGSARPGGYLIGLALVLVVSTALELGHLKKW